MNWPGMYRNALSISIKPVESGFGPFRSSLRDWIAETTDAPHEVAETILGHTVGGAVERAYRRTDYLEQRRIVMEAWGVYVSQKALGSSNLN